MKSRPKKFRQGDRITHMIELVDVLGGAQWVILHGQPKHPGFMKGMSLHTLGNLISRGAIYCAIENETQQGEYHEPHLQGDVEGRIEDARPAGPREHEVGGDPARVHRHDQRGGRVAG